MLRHNPPCAYMNGYHNHNAHIYIYMCNQTTRKIRNISQPANKHGEDHEGRSTKVTWQTSTPEITPP